MPGLKVAHLGQMYTPRQVSGQSDEDCVVAGQLPLGLFSDLGELKIKPSSLCQENRGTVL